MSIPFINYNDFNDAINGRALNPTACQDFSTWAKEKKLLIFDSGNNKYYFLDKNVSQNNNLKLPFNSSYCYRSVFVGLKMIARRLFLSVDKVQKLVQQIQCTSVAINTSPAPNELFFWEDEFWDQYKKYIDNNGISFREAQLRLGITEKSFEKIKNIFLPPSGYNTDKILPESIEGFINLYTYHNRLYINHTSKINAFIENFNFRHKSVKLDAQYCELCSENEKNIASDFCQNCKQYMCINHSSQHSQKHSASDVYLNVCTDSNCDEER